MNRKLLKRLLACVLAISVLPISSVFSGRVSAQQTAPRYMWNRDFIGGAVTDGYYQVTTAQSRITDNYTHLTAMAEISGETVDISKEWTDYTVEMDYIRNGAPNYSYGIYLIGRNNGQRFYALRSCGPIIELYRHDGNGIPKVVLKQTTFPTTADQWYHLKMTFKGNTITCTASNLDGTGAKTMYYTDTSADAPQGGGVGIYVRGSADTWAPRFDNFKVTDAAGEQMFFDDFSDERYMPGDYKPTDAVVYPQYMQDGFDKNYYTDGLTYQYNTSTIGGGVQDGCYEVVTSASTAYNHYTDLTVKTKDPDDPSKTADLADRWSDYAVELDFMRAGAPVTSHAVYLCGRYDGRARYELHASGTTLALYICDENGLSYPLAQKTFATMTDQWYHLKMEFKGNAIICTATNLLSKEETGFTVTDTPINAPQKGSPGIHVRGNETGWNPRFDNFKVTDVDGSVLFFDDYTDSRYFDGTTVRWFGNPVFTTTADGKLSVNAKNSAIYLVSAFGGQKNHALDWADYAVEANCLLTDTTSAAGLIANHDGSNYYELRLSTTGVKLCKVGSETETILASVDKNFSLHEWYSTKLEVANEGKKLKGYVNFEKVIEIDLLDDALTKGAMGLKAMGEAEFDDFAAYAVELSEARPFATYTFGAPNVTGLESNWDVTDDGSWLITEDMLHNNSDDTPNYMTLSKKATLDNYCAEIIVRMGKTGQAGILGRYSENGYYQLILDMEAGVTLYNGEKPLKHVSVEELYLAGVRVMPNTNTALKLYMYGNLLQGFVNGQIVISCVDEGATLTAGVTGLSGTCGAKFVSLTTSEAFALPAAAVLTITDALGQPLSNIQVYEGKVPDIMNMRLKVDYDGKTEMISLDYVMDYTLLDYNVDVGQTKTIPIVYQGNQIDFSYTVISRSEEIAALETAIGSLKDPEQLTLEDADAVEDLVKSYNDLSFKEKESISAENVQKLHDARETILTLRYAGKEVLGDVIFSDSFDTTHSDAQYTSDYMVTTDGDTGNWFVFNGEMLQYDSIPVIEEAEEFKPSNLLIEKDYEITSVSVDFQLLNQNAGAGLRFASRNGEYFRIDIRGKRTVPSMTLSKTTTVVYQGSARDVDPSLVFEPGNWYNLRVFQVDGWIRIYINNILCCEYFDVPTIHDDTLLTHGTVGMTAWENWCKFDNLEIRGKELTYEPETGATYNTNLPQTQWNDYFTEETVGEDPSHWLELSHRNDWSVKKEGENLYYGTTGCADSESQTWLHVFETDVDYTADLRLTDQGSYAVVGLMARLNADTSYIKAGYDFTLKKWFIKVRYGADFDEVTCYAEETSDFALDKFHKVRLRVEGTEIQVFADDAETPAVTADTGRKVSPGRVGIFNIACDVDVDNVELKQLSGQGRVNDGVMEQYTSQAGVPTATALFQIMELKDSDGTPNETFLMTSDSERYYSYDGGLTWTRDWRYGQYRSGSTVVLHDAKLLAIKGYKQVSISEDYGLTWKSQGTIPLPQGRAYAQPYEHLSEVKLSNGNYRIFFTVGYKCKNDPVQDDRAPRQICNDIFYSDDQGKTWTMAENSPMQFSNLAVWTESHIIKTKGVFEGDPLIIYTAYNNSNCMRYSLSYDEGRTWQGDYAMPQIACGWNTMTIEEDPYEPGTYYMATYYNIPAAHHLGLPRLRVALLRSTDGFHWEYLCDVDRWGDVSDTDKGHIMQGVNMYVTATKDYLFVSFSRSEEFKAGNNHRKQVGRLYRFEKSKLVAYDAWPEEYRIPEDAITHIQGREISVLQNTDLTDLLFDVYYYAAESSAVSMADAFVDGLDTSVLGEQTVVLDYKHFRTVFKVNVVECMPGDLDGNMVVDENDVIYLLQYLLMPEDFTVGQTVDYDKNGVVNEDDVIYLLQHLLMPEEFPLTTK